MRLEIVDGLKTLFYDGSDICNEDYEYEIYRMKNLDRDGISEEEWDEDSDTEFFVALRLSDECSTYFQERQSWEQVIVLDWVTVIPEKAFIDCYNIKKVIFANTVTEIKSCAFACCRSLVHFKQSIHLERIEDGAFIGCNLYSMFIPPSCRSIGSNDKYRGVFRCNTNLKILNVPQTTHIYNGCNIIEDTKLFKDFSFQENRPLIPDSFPDFHDEIHNWIKNINHEETCALHRACSSYHPLLEVIYAIIERKGLRAFNDKNIIGVTPPMYLKENPYAEITEAEVIRDYILTQLDEKK
ncbi:hypothetical protein CTEN210_02772 [Chaetoceros tenuissimus]|uniref:Uncharacterized protein n=1 Tax=Chaetoceros tenuissimus TaxID=426638 RepID=A0AAD3CI54_9STRA|nr:hypothetical protein CTEN210_02772 [Chaetoceros tenuissimus]